MAGRETIERLVSGTNDESEHIKRLQDEQFERAQALLDSHAVFEWQERIGGHGLEHTSCHATGIIAVDSLCLFLKEKQYPGGGKKWVKNVELIRLQLNVVNVDSWANDNQRLKTDTDLVVGFSAKGIYVRDFQNIITTHQAVADATHMLDTMETGLQAQ